MMVGKTDADYNPDLEQVAFYKENIQSIMREGKLRIVEEASTDSRTGETHYFQSIKKPLKGPDGQDRILVIAHDVTDIMKARLRIEENEKRYAYAMDAAGEGIWDWDIPQGKVRHNAKWCELLGLDKAQMVHDIEFLATLVKPDDLEDMMATLKSSLGGNGEYAHEHRMLKVDGSEIWVDDRGRVVEFSESGEPVRMVGAFTDITARKQAEEALAETHRVIEANNDRLEHEVALRTADLARLNSELQSQARTDALTGIANRRAFDERFESYWQLSCRNGKPISVIYIDVDCFKQFNDKYGHGKGDHVLKMVAESLASKTYRISDLVARYGGEEFVVLLPETELKQAQNIAEKYRLAIQDMAIEHNYSTVENVVTISGGIASIMPSKDMDPLTLLIQADKALYAAKQNGRNQICSQSE